MHHGSLIDDHKKIKPSHKYTLTHSVNTTSSWHSAKEILKKKGLFGLYRGFTLHLTRDTIGTGVYFGGYETTKYILNRHTSAIGPLSQFLAGGLCGLMCWIVVFPLDLIKTVIQKEVLSPKKRPSTLKCIQDIYRKSGLIGFYRGITVTLIRAFPIHSLNFLSKIICIGAWCLNCPTMTTDDFENGMFLLPTVEKAIAECDFLAVDTELSGLHRPPTSIRLYSMEDRYREYKEATERFLIIQFGLCTFTWDEPSGRYIAKPFNFYIFPTSMTGQVTTNRLFMTQAQAFDFLTKQSFDFNKWVYQGIPYLTKAEEEVFAAEASRKENIPDIPIDDHELAFVEEAREMIREWEKTSGEGQKPKKTTKVEEMDGVNIPTKNAYQRRLIYQEVRKYVFEGLSAIGLQGFIRVVRLSKKQEEDRQREKKEKFEKDCMMAIGFRKVIDMISKSRKLVVGHNMLLDMCHIIAQFVQPLPDTLSEFKLLAHKMFPKMIDTKHICNSTPELQSIFGTGTALETLRFETSKSQFKNPQIDMHPAFPRYLTDMAHEAGWDAFMTGFVFLKLVSYLDKSRNPQRYALLEKTQEEEEQEKEKERKVDADGWEISESEEENESSEWDKPEEEEVYNYGSIKVPLTDSTLSYILNKTALVRTAYEYFHFTGPASLINQSNTLHVQCNTSPFPTQSVHQIFSQYGKHIIEPDLENSQAVFIVFENLKEDPFKIAADGFVITPISKYFENRQ
ncbi:MAG: ribonuclease H-like domain-containing protein [Benjaminiella poitrasii]|nr:MAG: ribonuclease H-like domain-containing protein [Benjaminiella poitrasii]